MKKRSIFVNRSVMVIAALFCCILWGSAFPGIKLSYNALGISSEFEKLLLAGLRFTLAGLLVLAYAKIKGRARIRPTCKEMPLVLTVALLQTFGSYVLYYIALGYTSGVKASILAPVSVFFVAIYSQFMFKSDKLSLKKIIGLLCGFAGVVLVNVTLISGNELSFSFMGEGLIIIHTAMIGLTAVLIKKYAGDIDVVKMNGWQLLIGGLLLIAVGYIGHPHMLKFNTLSTTLLIYMAVLSAVAFSLWFTLLKHHNASTVEQFKFAVPLFGSFLSVLFVAGETIGIEALLAAVLVAIGIVIVNRQDVSRI